MPYCRSIKLMLCASAVAIGLTCGVSAAGEQHALAEGEQLRRTRGVVRAQAAATLSSELVARIISLPIRAGEPFHSGDVLLQFDCRRYEADLRAAEAEIKTQEIGVETSRQLISHGATGTSELALAEAKYAEAVAAAESLRTRTAECVINAPYDGYVVERMADVFDMPEAGSAIMRIVKSGQPEIDLIVPSSWVLWLKVGQEFPFKVDETETTYVARLLNIGAVVDPVSRTMKITALLLDPTPSLRPGMSGWAVLGPAADEAQ